MTEVTMFDQDSHEGDQTQQPASRPGSKPFQDPVAENARRGAAEAPLEWEEDATFVRARPLWLRTLRAIVAVALIGFVVLTAYRGARDWFESQLDPEGEPGESITVVVPSGATAADIGQILQELEVVPNSTFFRYYARWEGEENFQAGEYTLQLNSSAQEAIDTLNAGPKPQVFDRFRVLEGLWVSEMIPSIANQLDGISEAQLRAALNSQQVVPRYRPDNITSYEGVLFPDTYEVNADANALEIVQKMSDEFSRVTGELGFGTAENFLNHSAYEVVIVASLVEAETRVPEERPLVASVIYNRLREQIPLGIDATCLYGVGSRDPAALTSEVLGDTESPYACRGRIGLPPTPINLPSKASLEAAIRPAESEYLFYVLTNPNGTHTFAETEEEFFAAKAICIELNLGCG